MTRFLSNQALWIDLRSMKIAHFSNKYIAKQTIKNSLSQKKEYEYYSD